MHITLPFLFLDLIFLGPRTTLRNTREINCTAISLSTNYYRTDSFLYKRLLMKNKIPAKSRFLTAAMEISVNETENDKPESTCEHEYVMMLPNSVAVSPE